MSAQLLAEKSKEKGKSVKNENNSSVFNSFLADYSFNSAGLKVKNCKNKHDSALEGSFANS